MTPEIGYVDPGDNGEFVSEWRALAALQHAAHPFGQPDFVIAAADMARDDVAPGCLTFRQSGRLIGVLPLGFSVQGVRLLQRRTIRSISPGRIDITALLAMPELEATVAQAAHRELVRLARTGQAVDLRVVHADDPLIRLAEAPLRRGTPSQMRTASLIGKSSWREVISDGHQRRELDRTLRRLAEAGAEITWATTPAEAAGFANRFAAVHRDQQVRRARALRFGTGRPTAALAHLVSTWQGQSMADIALATLGGRDIAGYILWHLDEATWAYRTAFDMDVGRLAPGTALLAAAIDRAIARGSQRYEFSWGDQPYKARWSHEGAAVLPLQCPPLGLRGLLHRVAARLNPAATQYRPGLLPR